MPDLNEDEPVAGPLHLAETDDRLMWLLHVAANEWGAQGVAVTAALMADPDAVVGSLVSAGSARRPEPDGAYAYLLDDDTLDRLPRIRRTSDAREALDLRAGEDPAVASMRGRRDRAREHAVRNEQERDEAIRERDEARQALVDHAREAEQLAEGLRSTIDNLRDLLDGERARAERAEGLVEVPASLPSLDDDPRRPRRDHFPLDALTLTYGELRQLLALHVEAVGESVLSADDQARAMREGETPLRLAEVLDR